MDDRPDSSTVSSDSENAAPVSFWLKRAAQYSADLYSDRRGKSGLTQRQFTVLEAVFHNEGQSQTTLVRETGIDRSTLADLVNRLETHGYLSRKRSDKDARVNFVSLTEAGRDMLLNAQPQVSLVDQALVEALPERNRKAFVASLQVLSEKLDEAE
ncbi:MAG: MarR family winged helix-turn-helix transcriptional regulator [Pseudomonadota bacterium]